MVRRIVVPSRVNIIGEHTDYLGGLALAFTTDINLKLNIKSLAADFIGATTVVNLWKAAGGYPAELTVSSAIPIGKGMSSSAALCVAIAMGANPEADKNTICKIAQTIEHQILGTPCGLLDQMAMVFAKQDKATLIDFTALSVKHVELPESWLFKLVDSGIHRRLTDLSYNSSLIHPHDHVTEENNRVRLAVCASANELGKLLNESHASLSKLGVSLPAMDDLVHSIQQTEGVLGARMMGGGYGGMILVLVSHQDVLPDALNMSSSGPARFEKVS